MTEQELRYKTKLQLEPADLPSQTWDAIIVGAGPAGSTCAHALAGHGHTVLLLDKERFPRHKVCGDLLLPDSLAMLRRLGAWDRIARIAHHSHSIEVASPSDIRFSIPGEYLTLSRKRLDYELYRHALDSGACAALGNVVDIEPSTDRSPATLRLSNLDHTISARYVVLATGAVIDLAHRIGLIADTDLAASAIAMRCYVRSPHRRDDTIISYDPSILPGYAWIVPLGPDPKGGYRYNVGCGVLQKDVENGRHNLKKKIRLFMENFPPARELMHDSEIISPIAGASLRCGLPRDCSPIIGNALAIGETIGATYPFTGEGIGKAMETGTLAAVVLHDALAADDPSLLHRYSEGLDTLRPRYKGYAVGESWLRRRWLNDYVSYRITRSPYLQRRLQGFMAETEHAGRLFNPLSIILSYIC